jgi:predicted MPP superfamily phosphohydrolase
MKLSFLFFLIPFLGLIAAVSFAIFKAGITFGVITPHVRQIVGWIFVLMPIVLLITMAIGNFIYSSINTFFYIITVTWLPMLIYLFMAAALLTIINLLATSFGHPFNMLPLAIITIVIAAGATTFGIINATMPRVVTYEIDAPALSAAWSGKNIVLVSDTHLGVVRSAHFMEKVVLKINEQKPDLVLVAGDLIDGPVFNYAKGLAPLAGIQSTFGTVYTPGNHEGYNREPEKFYPAVRPLMTTLIDGTVEINNTTILGLDYRSEPKDLTAKRLAAAGFNANNPTIAILHDPTNTTALLDAGVSLVVSGHTHCGQFFPMTLLVRNIYKEFTYGVNIRDNSVGTKSVAVTTCGIGTAMSPLRLGTNPEVVVLHIK